MRHAHGTQLAQQCEAVMRMQAFRFARASLDPSAMCCLHQAMETIPSTPCIRLKWIDTIAVCPDATHAACPPTQHAPCREHVGDTRAS
eukprot:366054-Chlamydomonas_euryale.AAC.3